MKVLKEFLNESLLNEVSMDLALRAHAKAKGAQQNRIGKLIKQKVDRMIQAAAEAGVDVSKPSTKYHYKPETRDELKELVERLIEERGIDADLNDIDTSKITDMSYLFWESKFKGDISKWDVSNVKDMTRMFGLTRFNYDISKWDVSNVTNMSEMFAYSRFNGDISKWDVSNVTDMSEMFAYSDFKGDISKWDVRNVKDMSFMFKGSPLKGNEPEWYKG